MASLVEKRVKGPLDLSHHFSKTTRNRKESAIKDFYKYFSIPGIGNLAGGKVVSPVTRSSQIDVVQVFPMHHSFHMTLSRHP